MKNSGNCTNALIHETSPYLLQHAHNPVAWQPWGTAALAQARAEDKPILLSIGYSACHWCHVMAHESFEDPATAAVMNELFVNIKVDREERPDLDRIYQTAHQVLAQRAGGWPLTVFLMPDDHLPFFAGTYFPPEPRHGLPAFVELLRHIAEFYRDRRDELRTQNASLQNVFVQLRPPPAAPGETLDDSAWQAALRELDEHYDTRHGGFGRAPKFPHPSNLEGLLCAAVEASGDVADNCREMALSTLARMALGGINDQLGGGFCRYSVDEHWMIPHFEKMLYDNGPLLALYSQAAALTGDALFADTAHATAAWVVREMQSPDGGYYAAQDADSEGEEGKFYVWTPDQVRALLDADEYAVFAPRYGLDRAANFEGLWHLHAYQDIARIAQTLGIDAEVARTRIDSAREKLFTARATRVPPGRDEKILTAWNGLMIRGMAIAARHLDAPEYAESAQRAVDFLRTQHWRDGRLLASSKDGRAVLSAYLDDHAFLLDGLMELLQTRWRDSDLRFAIDLAEVLLRHFEDADNGGFFFTADDHEQLIERLKPLADEAIPAGNGVAAHALQRLGHLLGETRYTDAVLRTCRAAWPSLRQQPSAYMTLLRAVRGQVNDEILCVVRTDAAQPAVREMQADFVPARDVYVIPADARALPGILAERAPRGPFTAYLCRGHTCTAPLTSVDALREALGG